jgi:membrane-bound metal-dependent hydrolase YbcI (DUF457 family)
MPLVVDDECRHSAASYTERFRYASVYVLPGAGMTAILVTAAKSWGFARIGAWLSENYGMLVLTVYLALGGLFTALRPATMVRWTLRKNPELATHRDIVRTTRMIGLVILLIALLMIAKL